MEAMQDILLSEQARMVLRGLLITLVGFFIGGLLYRRLPVRRLHPQHQLLVRVVAKYGTIGLSLALALRAVGLSLEVVLGAAGILTVAIGFAAQTSASNLISGIFLMAEQPFVIGDVIKLGDTTGEVMSINLLSVRLRTFDNLLVRIPNESMLKSNVTNLTRYPIRRYDLRIGVAYSDDLALVHSVLEEVAESNPLSLEEPKPLVIFLEFGDSSVNFQFSVWCARKNFLDLRNSISQDVKTAFAERGITIPFPQRVIWTEPRPGTEV